MRIHRFHPESNFTILPNETLQDERLSFVALGILCQLVSRPDGWNVNADSLWQQTKRNQGKKTGQGREAIRAAFAELERYGYLVRRKTRDKEGQCVTVLELFSTDGHDVEDTGPSVWDTQYDADGEEEHRRTESRTSVDRASVSRASETMASSQRTEIKSTETQSTDEEDDPALADARAAADAAREERRLHRIYSVVDHFDHETLKDVLLKFERYRPEIYRRCRQKALAQLEQTDMRILNREQAAREVDNLSFKYGVLHYDVNKNWPGWMRKPLEEQFRRDQKAQAS